MEWRRRYFETQSDEHQRNSHVGQHWYLSGAQYLADGRNASGAGRAEHQSNPVKKKSSGKRAEQKIFE